MLVEVEQRRASEQKAETIYISSPTKGAELTDLLDKSWQRTIKVNSACCNITEVIHYLRETIKVKLNFLLRENTVWAC